MKVIRKIIEIDEELCDGCGVCVPSCAEGAIVLEDGKARVVAEKFCDGLGACIGECPRGALRITEREAEEFDEEAVEEHLQANKPVPPAEPATLACGCPSSQIRTFVPRDACHKANEPVSRAGTPSALSHWPVQIRLVPTSAPFLKDADLLVVADCVPVAYPDFHRDFLSKKIVLMGCPKFDDTAAYVEKFTGIFRAANIRSVTVLDMEVPCCSAMPMIVRKGMEAAGKNIPFREFVITTQGEILEEDSRAVVP